MNFLTTNFVVEDISSKFDGNFRLLDLPLEIIIKVLIFLDDPDLQSLGRTCRYLRMVSNESFISRSKYLYVKQKLGISLQIRPSSLDLYHRNLLPTPNKSLLTNFNISQFELANSLQKSFRKDSLARRLSRRPSKQELKERNILSEVDMSDLVKKRLKEFEKQNISQIFEVLVDSYKYQSQKETSPDIQKDDDKSNKSNKITLGLGDVSDEFTRVYLSFFKRLGKSPLFLSNGTNVEEQHNKPELAYHINDLLNHIGSSSIYEQAREQDNNATDVPKRLEPNLELSSVQKRRDFFEKLAASDGAQRNTHKSVLNDSTKVNNSKHPKMMLKASVINDNLINYEKVF